MYPKKQRENRYCEVEFLASHTTFHFRRGSRHPTSPSLSVNTKFSFRKDASSIGDDSVYYKEDLILSKFTVFHKELP